MVAPKKPVGRRVTGKTGKRASRCLVAGVPRRLPGRAPTIDLKQIEEVESAIGAKKVGKLLGLACAELTARPPAMRALADAHDFALLRSEAHGFKGAVACVGLVALARSAKAVELALPGAELHHSLDRLESEASRALAAVRSLLAQCTSDCSPHP